MNSVSGSRSRRSIYRKHLVLPTEHGSWSWLLVPFGVGAGVAGRFDLAVLLTLIAGLSVFLMRQPATVWLRVRRGRARKADGPLAAGWAVGFALIALLCTIGLIALGRSSLLWLAAPLAVVFGMYLLAAKFGRKGLRSMWMELAGAGGLAMMAPAALVAAQGQFEGQEWIVWALMATQNILGALYVRLRIHDTHGKEISRSLVLLGHGIGLILVILLALVMDVWLWLAAVPFLAFLIRAIWAVRRERPVLNVKRFGFAEMGIEILSGVWIAASYWITG